MPWLKTSLGIEIGSRRVSVAFVGKGVRRASIIKTWTFEIPEDERVKAKVITESIKRFLKRNRIRTKTVVFSIPRDRILTKIIELPPIKKKFVEQAINYEIESLIPYPIDQVFFSYRILPKEVRSQPTKVFLLIVRRDVLVEYLQLLIEAGLEPISLDVPIFVLLDSFQSTKVNSRKMGKLLVYLGPEYIEMMTFHGKTPINNKRLSFMGQGFNSNLILEVKKFINDCIDRKKEDGGVFLTGDPDLSYRFQKLLCGDLGVESEYLNLSSVFGLRPTGDDSFSTAAIGLAVRGIMRKIKKTDFLQDFQKEESVKRIPLLKTGVLGLTILLLSFGLLHLNLITKEKKLNDIRERLLKIQPQIGDHIERREGLEKRVNELRHLLNIERDRARWTRILQEIDLVLPKDTWITHLVLKKDELKELRGCTLGSSARLARILQSSKYFENVKFSGPILKDNFERQRIERFKLRADIIKERG